MRKWAFCFGLALAPAAAQFQDLATTDDSSRLYFATTLRQTGTQQPQHGKIFVVDPNGVRLFAMRLEEPPQRPPTIAPVTSNYFDLSNPDVSGDGTVVSIAGSRYCLYSQACSSVETVGSTLTGLPGQAELLLPGQARLSANGRFALLFGGSNFAGGGTQMADLASGSRTRVSSYSRVSRCGRVIASNGTAVFAGSNQIVLVQEGRAEPLPPLGFGWEEVIGGAVIDAAATVVVYHAARPRAFRHLRTFDVASRRDRVLLEGAGDIYQPCLSNDGRLIFLSTARFDGSISDDLPQLFLSNIDSSDLRQLTSDPAGIADATLSGDGRVAYVLTQAGRLLRLEVDSGAALELIGRTPALSRASVFSVSASRWVPYFVGPVGGVVRLRGAGFAEERLAATPPLPTSLGSVRVRLNGRPAPLLQVAPEEVWFQVPWELPQGQFTLEFETDARSAFEPEPGLLQVLFFLPAWQLQPGGFVAAAHGAFDAPVTPENPARPGEVVQLFATGLGPVDPPVATGAAAPWAPLARTVAPVTCSFRDQDRLRDIEIVFAGLAPGTVGTYQISLRVPPDYRRRDLYLNCQAGATAVPSVTLPVAAPPPRLRIRQ